MKLSFLFCVAGMPFNGETLETKSLGGSETAAICLAKAIAKLGHRVHMFCNTDKPGQWDGVNYHPVSRFLQTAMQTPSDVVVVQRAPEVFANTFASKVNILWQHDLAQSRNKERFSGTLWNIDRFALLSQYMCDQYHSAIGTPPEIIFKTRNGIDLSLFPSETIERDRKKLIYAARPERGLDTLVTRIMPELLKRDPEIKLQVCGYDNQVAHLAQFYADLHQKMAMIGAQWLGHLTKEELYKLYASAGVYVYPTPSPVMKEFAEISCITAMECQAVGLPIVSSNRGALPETIAPGAGVLLDGDPWTNEYVQKFCDAVMRYVNNEDRSFDKASSAGSYNALSLSWAGVAEEWIEESLRIIYDKNNDKMRLVKHFLRRSDVMAAKQVLEPINTDQAVYFKDKIARECLYLGDKEKYELHYDNSCDGHEGNWEDHTRGSRYMIMRDFVQSKQPKTVIDFGCAYGYYSIPLSNELPEIKFTGVDVSTKVLEFAKGYAKTRGDRVNFVHGDEDAEIAEQVDLLIAAETLEHVENPASTLRKIEKWVKPGGWVFITVPYGPWEELSYHLFPGRSHLWEVSQADIEDMIGHRAEFDLNIMFGGMNDHTNEPLGWLVASYQVDDQPVYDIDMERKVSIQAPRQSLSIVMIAGPDSEETLHWCLRSVRFVADEIIIGDTGMNEEARSIAKQYGAKLIPAPNPSTSGFETPRNVALKEATCDWVLWIDTDEKLLNPRFLSKYLRKNVWNGYGIRQHHFSVDAEFKADMPIRLFRTAPIEGKKIRFYGQIHEHPEMELNKGPGPIIVLSDIHIAHLGYLTEDVRKNRFSRNYPLLQRDKEKYPDRLLQKHFICRDNMQIAGFVLKQNGGVVTDEIVRLCEETIRLYREHFLGKTHYVNMETIQYYSDALRILGRGVDVSFNIAANRDGVGQPINGESMRFETEEEALAEVSWRTKNVVAPLLAEHW